MAVVEQRTSALARAILRHLPSSIDTTAVSCLEELYVRSGSFSSEELSAALAELQERHDIFIHNGWIVKVRK